MSFLLLPLLAALGIAGLTSFFESDDSAPAVEDDDPDTRPDPDPETDIIRVVGDDEDNVFYDAGGDESFNIQARGGNDRIDLNGTGDDVIFAGDGADDVDSGDGDDKVYLGKGDDYFGDIGGRNDPDYGGDDLVRGGGGSDALYSISGSDTLFGDTGRDLVSSLDILPQFDGVEARPDMAYGGAGNDIMIFDDGDTVSGGTGVDSFDLHVASKNATAVTITDYDPEQETLEIRFAGPNPLTSVNDFEDQPTFDDLTFSQDGDDTLIALNGQVLAIMKNTDVDDVQFSNIQVAG